MMRLTLRTLLAYLDDTLGAADSRLMGQKVAENTAAQELAERIKKLVRRRGLSAPPFAADGGPNDPTIMAAYLSDTLHGDKVAQFEQACLDSDVLLAEVAACHQILTIVLSQPVRVPQTARRRMYALVKGRESIPNRAPNPDIAPVGGMLAEETFEVDHDDADMALLLGMSAYSQTDSWGRRLTKIAAASVLAACAMVAVWLALPTLRSTVQQQETVYALAPVPTPATVVTPPPASHPDTPDPLPNANVPPDGNAPAVVPPNAPKNNPQPPMIPKERPKMDIGRIPQPPQANRVMAGRLAQPTALLLHRIGDETDWQRVGPTDMTITTTESVMAPPGAKGTVVLDTGVEIELWGNLPELLPSPLLWSSVVFHDPYEGFAADLTVRAGRIYIKTDKPDGAKVRLRFGGSEIWDVTLLDPTADVAFEVITSPNPGAAEEPAPITAGLAVVGGKVSVKTRFQEFPKIEKNNIISWDSKRRGTEGIQKLPDEGTAYFARFQTYPDPTPARAALGAVDRFNKRLTDPTRVKVVFAEALTETGAPSLDSVTAARIAVLTQAAMGEFPALVDAVEDVNRSYVREAAVFGLRAALAVHPNAAAKFRALLIEKARLTEEQADTVLRLLRGLTDLEKKSPMMHDQLLTLMSSNKVAVRELAFMTLLNEVDQESRSNRALASFDAGGPDQAREPVVRAWKRRIEELKKKATADPKAATPPPPAAPKP
ncbi:MAG: alanine and proline-rich secreted protein Apa [Bacteroidales bacterium]|nr:alanine and proline-rich secreted protein Apa [Bacteroidales bacterium]